MNSQAIQARYPVRRRRPVCAMALCLPDGGHHPLVPIAERPARPALQEARMLRAAIRPCWMAAAPIRAPGPALALEVGHVTDHERIAMAGDRQIRVHLHPSGAIELDSERSAKQGGLDARRPEDALGGNPLPAADLDPVRVDAGLPRTRSAPRRPACAGRPSHGRERVSANAGRMRGPASSRGRARWSDRCDGSRAPAPSG